jgi:hypothetical protein
MFFLGTEKAAIHAPSQLLMTTIHPNYSKLLTSQEMYCEPETDTQENPEDAFKRMRKGSMCGTVEVA